MYFEIIKSSIAVIFWAILAANALFLIVLFALKYFNKYNVRNAWFIILSIFSVPFFAIEFSIIFALIKVKNTMVVEAQEFTLTKASQIDHFKTNTTAFVDDQVTTKVKQASNQSSTINTAMNYVPENPVGLMLEKFPILAHFLDKHDITGNNATEIVESVFIKINQGINSIIVRCIRWIGIFLLGQCSLAVLFGSIKKRRKNRVLLQAEQS